MEQQGKIFNRGLLRYVEGDATQPRGGNRLLIHIVNTVNAWGAGFVLALSKRWKKPEEQYHLWYRAKSIDNVKFQLGEIQVVNIQTDLAVINMIAQEGINSTVDKDGNEVPPIRYDALRSCLEKVARHAKDTASSVHGPRFGSGLSGGNWGQIEKLINECLIDKGINVTIYDLPKLKKVE